jgi:hypothetical protein
MELDKALAGGMRQARFDPADFRTKNLEPVPSSLDSVRSPNVEKSAKRANAQIRSLPAPSRLARRFFRLLRPLALPFLNRLQWRVRAGVRAGVDASNLFVRQQQLSSGTCKPSKSSPLPMPRSTTTSTTTVT